jgi:hypothetical protein
MAALLARPLGAATLPDLLARPLGTRPLPLTPAAPTASPLAAISGPAGVPRPAKLDGPQRPAPASRGADRDARRARAAPLIASLVVRLAGGRLVH